jgi:hypothetical protein
MVLILLAGKLCLTAKATFSSTGKALTITQSSVHQDKNSFAIPKPLQMALLQ